MGVTLGAKTENGNFLALDDGKIAILIVINLHSNLCLKLAPLPEPSVKNPKILRD